MFSQDLSQVAEMSKYETNSLTMALLLLLLVPASLCYSMGAPDAACNAMTPGHQQQPQEVGAM